MSATWTVRVGWTSVRPVRPDQHFSRIVIAADDATSASCAAAQWVASRPECVMPTSTEIEKVVW